MIKLSFKEKQAIFSALRAPQHAPADVMLLKQKHATNANLKAYQKFATMKADKILYDLLEVATREEIIKNRRDFGKSNEQLDKEEADHDALQEEKSDIEEENDELQSENEELQDQNEDLEDQLEAEKKKEPTPKPVAPKKPAEKASPKKKNTRK